MKVSKCFALVCTAVFVMAIFLSACGGGTAPVPTTPDGDPTITNPDGSPDGTGGDDTVGGGGTTGGGDTGDGDTDGGDDDQGPDYTITKIQIVNPKAGAFVYDSTDDSVDGPINGRAKIKVTFEVATAGAKPTLSVKRASDGANVDLNETDISETLIKVRPKKYLSHGETYELYDGATLLYTFKVKVPGDVNGDGTSDILVGTSTWGQGKAHLFLGGDTLSQNADEAQVTIQEAGTVTKFGSAVALGDINGDGYDDMAVGAWYDKANPGDATSRGCVYVFYGSGDISRDNPVLTIDTDDDPADALGMTRICRGNGTTTGQFGYSLVIADINNDGYEELVVGANQSCWIHNGQPGCTQATQLTGSAYVFLGNKNGLSDKIMTASDNADINIALDVSDTSNMYSNLGSSLAAGDVDGDGIADLVIGAEGFNVPCTAGRVYVVRGNKYKTQLVDATANGTANDVLLPMADSTYGIDLAGGGECIYGLSDGFGYSVATVPAGGGKDNILVGDRRGRAYSAVYDEALAVAFYERYPAPSHGYSNQHDLLTSVGAAGTTTSAGIPYEGRFRYGSSNIVSPIAGYPWFGNVISELGDINGDGQVDYAVGSSHWDGAGNNYGRIHINATTYPAATTIEGTESNEFGHAIAVSRMR